MFDLSKKQHEVLLALAQFATQEGRMPSVRELAEHLGLAPATTQQHLGALARKGYLRARGHAHGLEILDKAWDHLRTRQPSTDRDFVRIPVIGSIAAGIPAEAIEDRQATLALPRQLAREGDFLLRVQGESLIDDGILDGDLALIRPQACVEEGDIAAALLPDGSATLKHVHFEPDAVVLRPANPSFASLRLGQVGLQGRLVGLWRRY